MSLQTIPFEDANLVPCATSCIMEPTCSFWAAPGQKVSAMFSCSHNRLSPLPVSYKRQDVDVGWCSPWAAFWFTSITQDMSLVTFWSYLLAADPSSVEGQPTQGGLTSWAHLTRQSRPQATAWLTILSLCLAWLLLPARLWGNDGFHLMDAKSRKDSIRRQNGVVWLRRK